jgi:hypothetical protein
MVIYRRRCGRKQAELLKALSGKTLFNALYGTYTVVLQELKALLKTSNTADPTKTPNPAPTQEDGFTDVRRCKRHSINEAAPTTKKPASAAVATTLKITTRNFFAPPPPKNVYGQ